MKKTPFYLLLIFIIGFIIPKFLISDGTDSFKGDENAFAHYAIYQTQLNHDDSWQQLLTLKLVTKKIRKLSETNIACGAWPPGKEFSTFFGDYEATVQSYTFFGIPLYSYTVHCMNSS